jgi:hypothetical protein
MTTSESMPLAPRTSRSAARDQIDGLGDPRAPEAPRLLQRLLGNEGSGAEDGCSILVGAHVIAVEHEHVGEVDVQGGQHLHRGETARLVHARSTVRARPGSPLSMASVNS